MRSSVPSKLERARITSGPYASDASYGNTGAFDILGPCGMQMHIVSSGDNPAAREYGWEHVSISLRNRCPNWQEMCFVKDLFFGDDEVVMQLHPAKKDYVNQHPYCLHLWKPMQGFIPLPPSILVGDKVGEAA